MINKLIESASAALDGISDGATILVGGFGAVGQPNMLIEALIERGTKNLTIVANNGGSSRAVGLPKLMKTGNVRKLICSYPMGAGVLEELHLAGKIELEIVPQGTLAERIRAGGAGVPAFYTPTSVGTILAQGKEHREFDGRTYVLERALQGDFALVEAWEGDRWGNLTYRGSGRNFNPIMAMAAATTIVQVHQVRELGDIDPNNVTTPSVYVSRVVQVTGQWTTLSIPKRA